MNSSPRFDIPCVILCGGKSSRMGEDKALLPFANSNSLSQYQYDRLKPYFKNIYLSSKTDKFSFISNIIYDEENQESSPLVALKSILKKLNSKKVFIITVDTPFVKITTINELIKRSSSYDITIATTKREHNLCAIYDKNCLCLIEEMIENNNHKIGNLINKLNTLKINFTNEDEFLNLNKKEDYLKALTLIS